MTVTCMQTRLIPLLFFRDCLQLFKALSAAMTNIDMQKPAPASERKADENATGSKKQSKGSDETSSSKVTKHDKTGEQSNDVCVDF